LKHQARKHKGELKRLKFLPLPLPPCSLSHLVCCCCCWCWCSRH